MTKSLDSNEHIGLASWSPDGRLIAYEKSENEIWLTGPELDPPPAKLVSDGRHPSWIDSETVVFESSGEIVSIDVNKASRYVQVSNKDISQGSVKSRPVAHPDSGRFLFCCHAMFDRESQSNNAYDYRHFLAIRDMGKKKNIMTRQQWYGGTSVWFPEGERIAHFEFDSTGGARVHVLTAEGGEEAFMGGHYPSVSPSGLEIAARPRGGGGLLVYRQKDGRWDTDNLESIVLRLPEASGRLSANHPWWLDERTIVIEEGKKIYKLDVRSEDAQTLVELPQLSVRGVPTMWPSPDGRLLLLTGESDDTASLEVMEFPA